MDEHGPSEGSARTTANVVQDVVFGTQTLFRQELELARHELTETVVTRARAAAAAAAGGVLALLAVVFFATSAAHGLATVMPLWAAWLIIAALFTVAALIALLLARRNARAGGGPLDRTKRSIQENRQWVRQRIRR